MNNQVMDHTKTLRILSVEDHPDTRTLLKHFLGETCTITFATGVEEALTALSEAPFDLLLVDINLGEEKSGVDLLRAVREREDAEKLPALAVTAYVMPGDREDLLAEGFTGYVSKPFTRDELFGAIEQVALEAPKERAR